MSFGDWGVGGKILMRVEDVRARHVPDAHRLVAIDVLCQSGPCSVFMCVCTYVRVYMYILDIRPFERREKALSTILGCDTPP